MDLSTSQKEANILEMRGKSHQKRADLTPGYLPISDPKSCKREASKSAWEKNFTANALLNTEMFPTSSYLKIVQEICWSHRLASILD